MYEYVSISETSEKQGWCCALMYRVRRRPGYGEYKCSGYDKLQAVGRHAGPHTVSSRTLASQPTQSGRNSEQVKLRYSGLVFSSCWWWRQRSSSVVVDVDFYLLILTRILELFAFFFICLTGHINV